MSAKGFTIDQLKYALNQRQLPTTGRKTELIVRLDQADPSGRWKEEMSRADNLEQEKSIQNQLPENTDHFEHQESSINCLDRDQSYQENAMSALRDREFDLIRRERDLAEYENSLLRREVEMLRAASRSSTSSTNSRASISIRGISELLHEYNGTVEDFERWKAQVMLLKTTYELDDNSARVLVGAKLKGKAFTWYHSRPEHLQMGLEELLKAVADMFDHRPGRLELCRKFEARAWQTKESFSDYCYEKTILGNQVPIAEEELVDYVIDGIPDEQHAKSSANAFVQIVARFANRIQQNQVNSSTSRIQARRHFSIQRKQTANKIRRPNRR